MAQNSKITLVPQGGLGNRMRTIVSGIMLAEAVDAELEIVWFRDWGLGCRYDALLQPIDLPFVRVREATALDLLLRDHPRRRNLWIPLLAERLCYDVCIRNAEFHTPASEYIARCRGKRVWLSSCGSFMSKTPDKERFRLFRPQQNVQQLINQTARLFGNHRVVGVHLRRTDSVKSIEESPTTLFIERMKAEPADTLFFVATDSEEDKHLLRESFGKRVVTSGHQADRASLEGMRDAAADMFLLAGTEHILGSFYSSFSEIASYIGGNTLEIVQKA